MRILFPSLLLLLAACPGSEPRTGGVDGGAIDAPPPGIDGATDPWCVTLPGNRFEAPGLECGLESDGGVALCAWSLEFEGTQHDGTYTWFYSDVGETGTWHCWEGTITATRGGAMLTAEYDQAAETVTWDGHVYTRVP